MRLKCIRDCHFAHRYWHGPDPDNDVFVGEIADFPDQLVLEAEKLRDEGRQLDTDGQKLVNEGDALRAKLRDNTIYFRTEMARNGFDIPKSDHPIAPIMLYDATVASNMAAKMLELGVYVIAFSYPVVPMGKARIRTQISAAHSLEDLEMAVKAFVTARK